MTTAQRVEGLNNFLKKNIIRFEEALKRIWKREHESEYDCKYRILRLHSALNIERQLRDVYTNNIFY
jgi:hypothetical protein